MTAFWSARVGEMKRTGESLMAVYDRWHKSRPRPGELVCRERKMVPAAGHGIGDRWQVRWRDEDGEQRARKGNRRPFPLEIAATRRRLLSTGRSDRPDAATKSVMPR